MMHKAGFSEGKQSEKLNQQFSYKWMLMVAMMFAWMAMVGSVEAQTVKHPISGVSTTAQFYSYIHQTSPTVGIEIKYFIIRAPNGDIKTAFDACDVCWYAYAGYVQLGTFMRCVNCGNTYPTNSLGSTGTGGCWPSYLPHTEDATDVIINISDIEGGAHFFQEVIISGLNHHLLPSSYMFRNLSDMIVLELPKRINRKVRLIDLNGREMYQVENSATKHIIDKKILSSGVYILTVEESGEAFYKRFLIE